MSTRKHFHVINSMHGYMPDSNDVYEDKKTARYGLKDLVQLFRDSGERFRGNVKDGYFESTTNNRYISIEECYMQECLEHMDGDY